VNRAKKFAAKLFRVVRFLIYVALVVLEPVIRLLLGGLALLGLLVAIFFKLAGTVSHSHVWFMIALSIGCGIALATYHVILGFVAPQSG
jgi:hypothetical protein